MELAKLLMTIQLLIHKKIITFLAAPDFSPTITIIIMGYPTMIILKPLKIKVKSAVITLVFMSTAFIKYHICPLCCTSLIRYYCCIAISIKLNVTLSVSAIQQLLSCTELQKLTLLTW